MGLFDVFSKGGKRLRPDVNIVSSENVQATAKRFFVPRKDSLMQDTIARNLHIHR